MFIIFILLFLSFKIIPNLKIKKHITKGSIDFQSDKVIIYRELTEKIYPIEKLDFISLKLVGWDGQHRFGNIESLGNGNSSMYQNIRPVDGLGNIVKLIKGNDKYQFEFYADSIKEYEVLKKTCENWKNLNTNVQIKILR